jgi:hypothetical protein
MRRLVALLLALSVLAPASALAGTGGASAPAGGTGASNPGTTTPPPASSGGHTSGSTGGTTVGPSFVPGGGGGPAGGTSTTYSVPPRAPDDQSPVRSFARTDVPPAYLALYRSAARRYGVDWRLLAALGKNESDHGRAPLPGVLSGLNFANCCSGPMQICQVPACGNVWQAYGRDGNGDGVLSIYDPADAIESAAALVVDIRRVVGTNPRLIMAGYNAGPGNVKKFRGIPPYSETILYVRNGIRYMRALRG